jgi:hypothetical protein
MSYNWEQKLVGTWLAGTIGRIDRVRSQCQVFWDELGVAIQVISIPGNRVAARKSQAISPATRFTGLRNDWANVISNKSSCQKLVAG